MERHVLVVFPHPDDETLAAGGAVALQAKQGSTVTYACFTLGQMGRNMGKPFFANRETLPEIREKELHEACAALGISDLRMMGFRDKTLEFEDPETLIGIISDLLAELKPTLLITYYPGYCVHPDHEALAAATMEAVRRLPDNARPKIYCQAFSRNHETDLGARDVLLDTSSVWENKYRAMKAHKTQTAARIEEIERALAAGGAQKEQMIAALSQENMYSYRV